MHISIELFIKKRYKYISDQGLTVNFVIKKGVVFMKKIIALFISLMLLMSLSGCNTQKKDAKDELFNYVSKELALIKDLEAEAISKYSSIMTEDTPSQAVLIILESDVLPNYKEFYEKLTDIELETEDVKNLHQIYVLGAQKQLEAFTTLYDALINSDEEKYLSVKEIVDEAKVLMDSFETELKSLADKYNLKYEE